MHTCIYLEELRVYFSYLRSTVYKFPMGLIKKNSRSAISLSTTFIECDEVLYWSHSELTPCALCLHQGFFFIITEYYIRHFLVMSDAFIHAIINVKRFHTQLAKSIRNLRKNTIEFPRGHSE